MEDNKAKRSSDKFPKKIQEKNVVRKIITSESVNIGHPDKTCDVIADAFLDEALRQDPHAQMAVECAIKDYKLFIYGEATTTAKLNYDKIAKEILRGIGYANKFKITKQVSIQSPEINSAVVGDNNKSLNDTSPGAEELKSNDQGIVYGYASNETTELMPMPIIIAHKLMKRYEEFRREFNARQKSARYFPDAKSQVSIMYENDDPAAIHTVLVSVSHSDCLTNAQIVSAIRENVIDVVLGEYSSLVTAETKYIINPSGKFTIWGSFGDSGCVGRKIVVDTYGGVGRIGGGAFSSKNATKVDRSGAYYARYVAKNIVAHGMADRAEVSASYAIGVAKPIKINIETFNTNKVEISKIEKFVEVNFDFSPANMIYELDLLKPQFKATACYGHFGRAEFPWERIKQI